MSIDKKRARDFAGAVEDLAGRLDAETWYETVRDKLIDLAARGRFDFSDTSLRDAVRAVARDFDPALAAYADRIWKDFDKVTDLVNRYYGDIGPGVDRGMKTMQRLESLSLKQIGSYGAGAKKDIAKQLRLWADKGESREELIDRFARNVDDKVKGYAETLGKTLVGSYGQAGKMESARLGGVFYHEYIGLPLRPNSHVFCVQVYGAAKRTFHLNDIKKMRNGQIEPVWAHRGGFNCNHRWEPDPFYDDGAYSVSIVEVMDGNRVVKVGRHG